MLFQVEMEVRLPHDMAYTENYAILNDCPLFWIPEALAAGKYVSRFHPDIPMRLGVLPRWGMSALLPRAVGHAMAVEMTGTGPWQGHSYKIFVKNENIVTWLDGKPDAMSPDFISNLDPKTGAIRAMVGGYDFTRSEYNRAVLARRCTARARSRAAAAP